MLRKNKKIQLIFTAIYALAFALYLFIGFQPAEAITYEVDAKLTIERINLEIDVIKLEQKNHELETPQSIVGSYSMHKNKTLLIGHSSTAFKNLGDVTVEDTITYNNEKYTIYDINILKKDSVNMEEILRGSQQKTIILMTCTGKELPNSDATERLLVYAKAN